MLESLMNLRRVDDGEPATLRKPGKVDPVYVVCPGDAAHYEVAPRGDLCVVTVGQIDGNLEGIVLHRSSRKASAVGAPSFYVVEVCTYLAELAFGWAPREPVLLSRFRPGGDA